MKKQKGFSLIIIIAIVAVVILAGVFLVFKMTAAPTNLGNQNGQPVVETQQPTQSAIQNSAGLDAAATDLDKTDIDSVNTELNQLDKDATAF